MEENKSEAYLDIETTSLYPFDGIITVIGIYITSEVAESRLSGRGRGRAEKFIQLVGEEITKNNLLKSLEGVEIIYTYNGKGFDLPFIKEYVGIELTECFKHRDLMYDCWNKNLYGGFKKVEEALGIERESKGIDGRIAVDLWHRYKIFGDEESLKSLLKYNKEDVMNLKILKVRLGI